MLSQFIISTVSYKSEETEVYVIIGEDNFRSFALRYTLEYLSGLDEDDDYKELDYRSPDLKISLTKLGLSSKFGKLSERRESSKLIRHILGIKNEKISNIIDFIIATSINKQAYFEYIQIWFNVVVVEGNNFKLTNYS